MSGPASEITSYLFVGGSSAAQDEADLASRRITHVGEARAVAQQLHSVCVCVCVCVCTLQFTNRAFSVPDSARDIDRRYFVLDSPGRSNTARSQRHCE